MFATHNFILCFWQKRDAECFPLQKWLLWTRESCKACFPLGNNSGDDAACDDDDDDLQNQQCCQVEKWLVCFHWDSRKLKWKKAVFILPSPFLWSLCLPPQCQVDFPYKKFYFHLNNINLYVGKSYEGAGYLQLHWESCSFFHPGKFLMTESVKAMALEVVLFLG